MAETILSKQIKELREKNYTYALIAKELNCSKGTVCYHLGVDQKLKHKSRRIKRTKEEVSSNREWIKSFSKRYKALCGCKECGIKNPIVLEYDHRDPKEKEHNIAQMISDRYSMKSLKREIRKCDVLCANCHRIKTFENKQYQK